MPPKRLGAGGVGANSERTGGAAAMETVVGDVLSVSVMATASAPNGATSVFVVPLLSGATWAVGKGELFCVSAEIGGSLAAGAATGFSGAMGVSMTIGVQVGVHSGVQVGVGKFELLKAGSCCICCCCSAGSMPAPGSGVGKPTKGVNVGVMVGVGGVVGVGGISVGVSVHVGVGKG